MLLRCVQAAGSASTIALSEFAMFLLYGDLGIRAWTDMDDSCRAGAGVVADISEPHERGTFFGFMGIGPMVGPCLGPGIVSDAPVISINPLIPTQCLQFSAVPFHKALGGGPLVL